MYILCAACVYDIRNEAQYREDLFNSYVTITKLSGCVRITQMWLIGGNQGHRIDLKWVACDAWGKSYALKPMWCVASMMCGDLSALKPIWCLDQFDVWPNMMCGDFFILKYWFMCLHHLSTSIALWSYLPELKTPPFQPIASVPKVS